MGLVGIRETSRVWMSRVSGTRRRIGTSTRRPLSRWVLRGWEGDAGLIGQVVDYSPDLEDEMTNVKIEFEGSRLKPWLESKNGKRSKGDDGRIKGVRWCMWDASADGLC
jgi:hypothetical protein